MSLEFSLTANLSEVATVVISAITSDCTTFSFILALIYALQFANTQVFLYRRVKPFTCGNHARTGLCHESKPPEGSCFLFQYSLKTSLQEKSKSGWRNYCEYMSSTLQVNMLEDGPASVNYFDLILRCLVLLHNKCFTRMCHTLILFLVKLFGYA